MDHVSRAVANVLSSNRVRLSHPGASKLSELYCNPSEATSYLAETVQSYHRVRVTANNLNLGTQSNFTISTSSIVSSLWLHVGLAASTGYKLPCDGWLYNAIHDVQITFSNSLLSNMVIPGSCLRDMMLISCLDKPRREMLLRLGGEGAYNTDVLASIPIGHILANASFQSGNFPIDFSVLNGPVLLTFTWNPGYNFVVKATGAFVPPTAWSSCYVTGMTTDLTDSAFAVKSAMAMDPQLQYVIPGRWSNTVVYNLPSVNPGVEQTINLQSGPAGQLSAILLSIRPAGTTADTNNGGPPATSVDSYGWFGISAGTQMVHGSSVRLSSLVLQYGGQRILDNRSYAEIIAMNMAAFEGDALTYDERYSVQAGVNNTVGDLDVHSQLIVIPFGYNMRHILSEKHSETLPSYSGATLQLSFTVAAPSVSLNAAPFQDTSFFNLQNAQPYVVSVSYLLEALVTVSQGTVDMQL